METPKKPHGGKRAGAGRKDPKTKSTLTVSLDNSLIEWLNERAGGVSRRRSMDVNRILCDYRQRTEEAG